MEALLKRRSKVLEVTIYLTPLKKTQIPFEPDAEGNPWGFSEYAEMYADPQAEPMAAAKALDRMANEHILKDIRWCRAEPRPHYRVTRMRYRELINAGCVKETTLIGSHLDVIA